MPRIAKTPGSVLQAKIAEYGLTPAETGKALGAKNLAKILSDTEEISIGLSLKLAKYFGGAPEEWTKLQLAYSKKQLEDQLRNIEKAKKQSAPAANKGGRPSASSGAADAPRNKGGRPPKNKTLDASGAVKPKGKGGRPPKAKSADSAVKPAGRRGRPPKQVNAETASSDSGSFASF